jgi:hypothetical protein
MSIGAIHDHTPFECISTFNGIGSSGCMSNPMYKNVCSLGKLETQSGRNKKRFLKREQLKEERKQSSSYGKPRCKKTKGFI